MQARYNEHIAPIEIFSKKEEAGWHWCMVISTAWVVENVKQIVFECLWMSLKNQFFLVVLRNRFGY